MTFLNRADANLIRAELRKLFKAGRLQYRRTYYDYYDSCHAPEETPDAVWVATPESCFKELYAGGAAIAILGAGHYKFSTGYMTFELKLKSR